MEKQTTTPRGNLEALLNSCPDAILAINAEGVIKFANNEACKLTERNMNELIGESIVEVYENIEAAREANRKIYEAGGTIHNMDTTTKWKALAAPVFELYPGLSVMVIVGHLDVDRFEDIITNLLNHVEEHKTRVVLLDLSASVMDEEKVAEQLKKTVRAVRLLGAECVVAGMQPALARALEPLITDISMAKNFSCMELALEAALDIIGCYICPKE
jgi:anti-anti-sigma regulatory factor